MKYKVGDVLVYITSRNNEIVIVEEVDEFDTFLIYKVKCKKYSWWCMEDQLKKLDKNDARLLL